MNRSLASLISLAAFSAFASAQCFEPNFGTNLGNGDDNLWPATPAPMNITFPMGGVASSYTTVRASTNGALFLSNGTDLGSNSTFSPAVSDLQGPAGSGPRIAPYWRDLNLYITPNSGIYLNNTIPGKCVITWRDAVHYATTSPVFTFQAQLFSDGRISFFYAPNTQNVTTTEIVGVSQANAISPLPPAVNLSAGSIGVSTQQLVYQTFATANTFQAQLAGKTVTFTPNALGGYDVSTASCIPAFNATYGSGCYNTFASLYENLPTTFDLANSSLTLTKLPVGYAVSQTSVPLFTHVSPTVLTLFDDSETLTPALSTPFPYDGGAAATLDVCSNGFISVASGNGISFSQSVSSLLNGPQTGWYTWHDFNPTLVGSGLVKFEEVGGVAYVTWDGVYNYGGSSAADASTIQYQFNESNGNINIVFGSVSTTGNGFLIGYSPGGPSADPGSMDLDVALPINVTTDVGPGLALSAAPTPVLGNTVTYTVSNVPASLGISVVFLSFGQTAPTPLPSIGINSPGCFTHINLSPAFGFGSISPLLLTSPTASQSLTIPSAPVWAGVTVYLQAAALAPAASPAGVITSNAVSSFINSF